MRLPASRTTGGPGARGGRPDVVGAQGGRAGWWRWAVVSGRAISAPAPLALRLSVALRRAGDYVGSEGWQALEGTLSGREAEHRGCPCGRLYYLALPPSVYPQVCSGLKASEGRQAAGRQAPPCSSLCLLLVMCGVNFNARPQAGRSESTGMYKHACRACPLLPACRPTAMRCPRPRARGCG